VRPYRNLHKDFPWYFPGEDQAVEKEVVKTKKSVNKSTVSLIQASCNLKLSENIGGRND
jgi:hypothetical protein